MAEGDSMSATYTTYTQDTASNEEMGTNLHKAAVSGNKKKLKKVLESGIFVDFPNSVGQTALFTAAYEGQESIVKYLLKKGANPNIKSQGGCTPLHAAGLSCNTKILSMLIEYGGDLRLHDNKGRTVEDWANLQADPKKRRKMMVFLEKKRLYALTHSKVDIFESQPSPSNSRVCEEGTAPLSNLFRHRSSSRSLRGTASLQNMGYGKMFVKNENAMGAAATIPLVAQSSLHHDFFGFTYNNGAFMVMESMFWDKTKVTVKRLHTKAPKGGIPDLLITESEYMSKLRHPNLLLLMGVCQISNMDGLVLLYERVSCGSLYYFIYQKLESFEAAAMCDLMRQICDGVLFLHQQNILHCCITSHAIQLICPTVAKLGNFEYMIEKSSVQGPPHMSDVTDNVYRNAAYNWMAPEVMAGEPPTEVSDLYSICSVIWEVLTGELPWSGLPAHEIRARVVERHSTLAVDQNCEHPFDVILQSGLSLDPADRWINVDQLRDLLYQYLVERADSSFASYSTPRSTSSPKKPIASRSSSKRKGKRAKAGRKVSKVYHREVTPEPQGQDGDRAVADTNLASFISASQDSSLTLSAGNTTGASPEPDDEIAAQDSLTQVTLLQKDHDISDALAMLDDALKSTEIEANPSAKQKSSESPVEVTKNKKSRLTKSVSFNKSAACRALFTENTESPFTSDIEDEPDGAQRMVSTNIEAEPRVRSPGTDNPFKESLLTKDDEEEIKALAVSKPASVSRIVSNALLMGPKPYRRPSELEAKPSTVFATLSRQGSMTGPHSTTAASGVTRNLSLCEKKSSIYSMLDKELRQSVANTSPTKDKEDQHHSINKVLQAKIQKMRVSSTPNACLYKTNAAKKITRPKPTVHSTPDFRSKVASSAVKIATTATGMVESSHFIQSKPDEGLDTVDAGSFCQSNVNGETGMSNTKESTSSSLMNRSDDSRTSWVLVADDSFSGSCTNFKPASHQCSLSESPTGTSRTSVQQQGSQPDLLVLAASRSRVWSPIPRAVDSISRGILNIRNSSTLPRPRKSPVQQLINESHGMQKYRSETYLDLLGDGQTQEKSPDRISPRLQKDQWYGGNTIKDLIQSFQTKVEKHKEKQTTMRNWNTRKPTSPANKNRTTAGKMTTEATFTAERPEKVDSAKQAILAPPKREVSVAMLMIENTIELQPNPDFLAERNLLKNGNIDRADLMGKDDHTEGKGVSEETSQALAELEVCVATSQSEKQMELSPNDNKLDDSGLPMSASDGEQHDIRADVKGMDDLIKGKGVPEELEVCVAALHSVKYKELPPSHKFDDSGLPMSASDGEQCAIRDETPLQEKTDDGAVKSASKEGKVNDNNNARRSLAQSSEAPDTSTSDISYTSGETATARLKIKDKPDMKKRMEVEEFYFDDELRPDLFKEKYMRLQTTMALDGSPSTPETLFLTPASTVSKLSDAEFETPTGNSSCKPSAKQKLSNFEDYDEPDGWETNNSNNAVQEEVCSSRLATDDYKNMQENLTIHNDEDLSHYPWLPLDCQLQDDDTIIIHKDVSLDEGGSSAVRVETNVDSDSHTVTSSNTDLVTGQTTTSCIKVTAKRVIVTMEDDDVNL